MLKIINKIIKTKKDKKLEEKDKQIAKLTRVNEILNGMNAKQEKNLEYKQKLLEEKETEFLNTTLAQTEIIKTLKETKKELEGAKGGLTKENNKLKEEKEALEKELEEVKKKLEESMTDKYLVKKIKPAPGPRKKVIGIKRTGLSSQAKSMLKERND